MYQLISLLVSAIIIFGSIKLKLYYSRRYTDLFKENEIPKLYTYNYSELIIKRSGKMLRCGMSTIRESECPLENEIEQKNFYFEDYIEVYGIESNKEHLLFRTNWSKPNVEKIKCIVSEINKSLTK